MKSILYCTLILSLIFVKENPAGQHPFITYYEQSGFKASPPYQETIAYCRTLADASPWISYTTFGTSPQGRDLPLLIIDKNGHSTAQQVRQSGKVVFFIQAGIHAGEIDGKDAGFLLIRDLAIDRTLAPLLDHVTVLFNPIFNVDGHERRSSYNRANQNGPAEMGWRTTAQNLNLNRDYLKADAPEMRSWLKLYNKWLPDFFADCHVTDGADYQYAISYKIDTHGIIDTALVNWTENEYLPPLKQAMQDNGFPLIEYVALRKRHDVTSGIATWAAPPRFSDGYTALRNRPGLLIETHMFKDYRTRVEATYEILKQTLVILNQSYANLRGRIQRADKHTASAAFREDPFPVTYKYSRDSIMIDFLGYDFEVIKSDVSGGNWYRYFRDRPKVFHIPLFNKMEPDVRVKLPGAYIVPAEWTELIERLPLHGIFFYSLKNPETVAVESYRFENVKFAAAPYEGRQTVKYQVVPVSGQRVFPAGSVLIPMNQATAKVIANILEPQAPDAYVQWGFFNAIFEQKEYIEDYVMEERARLMLASDPELNKRFRSLLESDSSFAGNPRAILNWFFRNSPYWDQKKDIYPVGKIYDASLLNQLILRSQQ